MGVVERAWRSAWTGQGGARLASRGRLWLARPGEKKGSWSRWALVVVDDGAVTATTERIGARALHMGEL